MDSRSASAEPQSRAAQVYAPCVATMIARPSRAGHGEGCSDIPSPTRVGNGAASDLGGRMIRMNTLQRHSYKHIREQASLVPHRV